MLQVVRPDDALQAQQLALRLGGQSAFVGGGTALQLGWGDAPPALTLIDVSALAAGQGVSLQGGDLRIGAAVRLEALRRDPLAARHAPLLVAACQQLGALPVRLLATLGGNVGWGFGDTLAPLLAMQARAELADGSLVPLAGLFDAGALPLIVALRVRQQPGLSGAPAPIAFFEKVGLRAAFSPSRLSLALVAALDPQGRIGELAVAACGAGLRARRLVSVQQALAGQTPGSCDAIALRQACREDLPDHAAQARLASRLIAGHLGGCP